MFGFIRRFLGIPEKKRETESKMLVEFGGGPGRDKVNAVWGKIWNDVLQIDERFKNINSDDLLNIEQHIKQGITEGRASQKMATELRPIFESVGLKRKDALTLAATATNLVYMENQKHINIGANFVMGVQFKRDQHEKCGPDCWQCSRYAGKKQKSYRKNNLKGLSLEQFIKNFGPPYHDGCTCTVEEIIEDATTFVKNAREEYEKKGK